MTSPMHSPLQSPLQPVMRSPLEFRRRGGGSFDPVSALFGSGQQGVLYDPSVMSSLFQDSAGTIPVTAADQTVGKMLDLSGNGNHATQADASKRPILRNSGALWWLEFDGVNDCMYTAAVNFSGAVNLSAWAGITKASTSTGSIFESGANRTNVGAFGLRSNATGFDVGFNQNGFTQKDTTAVFPAPPQTLTIATAIDGSLASYGAILWMQINGADTPLSTGSGAGNTPGGMFGDLPLYVGSYSSGFYLSGNLYSLIIAGALYDANTVAKMNQYVAKKTGVTL